MHLMTGSTIGIKQGFSVLGGNGICNLKAQQESCAK
jgi:hypothetical protein